MLLLLSALGKMEAQNVWVGPADIGVNWYSSLPAADTRSGGTVSLVNGPGTAPMGCGSLQMTTTDAFSSSQAKAQCINYSYIGTPISSINALSYYAYRSSVSTNSLAQTIGLNIGVDVNGPASGGFTTLVFEPVYQPGGVGAMLLNTWQYWDAFDGGNAIWWSSNTIPGVCGGGGCFVTWNTILANNPAAVIVSSIGFSIGSGWVGQYTGAADALTIGLPGNVKTYNFEQVANNVVNTNTGRTYCTIQSAINDPLTDNGHTIVVSAGTYNESVTINKSLTLLGANASVSPCSGTRNTESTIMGAFTIAANSITIKGFEFTGAGAQIASSAGVTTWSNIDIQNNWLHATTAQIPIRHGLGLGGGIGTSNWTVSNNKIEDIQLNDGTAIALFNINNVVANNNCITHANGGFIGRRGINADGLQNATLNGNSINMGDINPTTQTNAIFGFQVSMSDRDATGITINGNVVSNVYRAVVVLSQRNLTGLTVQNNEFGPVVGGVDCNTGGTIPQIPQPVQSNINIKNNKVTTVTTAIPGAFGAAVRLRNLHSATANGPVTFNNVQINENSFIVTAAAIIYEAGTGISNENATCNWYGSTSNAVIATKITGPVTYIPYLTNGTDNSAAIGFQPVPASCNGVPRPALTTTVNAVTVVDNNDASPDVAALGVCNTPADNLFFSGFNDLNNIGPVGKVRVRQEFTHTNTTWVGPSPVDGDHPLSAYAGAFSRQIGLVNPGAPGTLTMSFQVYYDANSDNVLDGGDYAGDKIIYTVTVTPQVKLNTSINSTVVNSNNDGADDNASFSVCNKPNNILFDYFADANGLTGPMVKAYQVIQTTNVTVPFCNNCSAALTAFGGASGTASLIDPTMPGTLVMKFKGFYDTDMDGQIGANECGGDWVIYTVTIDPNVLTINCPADMTIDCQDDSSPANTGTATGSGSCDNNVTISHADQTVPGGCPNSYTINRTWKITDALGNTNSCVQVITVQDVTNPTISCPSALILQCASQVPVPNVGSVTASDNCGSVTVTHVGDVISNQTCANRYTITRTYKATDACGNFATCTQTITVNDNTNPTISCPAAITVQCASQVPAPNVGSVTASDNCGAVTVTHVGDVISNQTCANRFIVTRTYRATDACGNMATCTQTITVNDNTPPTITCPPNKTVSPTTLAGTVVTYTTPVVSDNCSVVGVPVRTAGPASGSTFPIGTTTVTYQVTDACGNTASCSFTVTVIDPYCDDQKKKAYVCHNGNTLCVSINAVQAHLNHGDYLGQCTTSFQKIVTTTEPTKVVTEFSATTMESKEEFRVNVSPNPSSGAFRIQVISKSIEPISVRVMDLSGKVLTFNSNVIKGSIVLGNELRAGTYIAEVIQGTSRQVIKLVKVN